MTPTADDVVTTTADVDVTAVDEAAAAPAVVGVAEAVGDAAAAVGDVISGWSSKSLPLLFPFIVFSTATIVTPNRLIDYSFLLLVTSDRLQNATFDWW